MHILEKILLLHVLTCLGQNGHGSEIIHGHKVPEGSMLYMVSVQNNAGHVCGGFLISEKFVVTAAHCDINEPTHVVLGTQNLNAEPMTFCIKQRYKPETYVSVGQGDDIMLLELCGKAQLNNRVRTIRLPQFDTNTRENQLCRVAGWGSTKSYGHVVNELRMVNVSVINPRVCKDLWPGLPDNVICAGGYGTNKGFCQGDSGGPLVCNEIAVGVVSFNKNRNCDYPDVPNVYTDVSRHIYWINSIIKQN